MARLTYIFLLQFLNYTFAADCVNNNVPDYITWEIELLKDLRCGYDPYKEPNGTMEVNIMYALKSFNLDSDREIMTMQTFLRSEWTDERLKWDPEKYHGIKKTEISHLNIWSPGFRLANTEDYFLYSEMFVQYHCDLKSSGLVSGAFSMVQEAMCTLKLTDWPYDVQECSYEFGPMDSPWSTRNYSINFHFQVVENSSAEWYIYDHKEVKNNKTKRDVKLTIYLMREAVGLAAIVIYPALILTVLSILSLCLDVRRQVRLSISCFSLLGHYYFLTEIAYDIQKQSNYPPTLLLYYRGSVVLNILIILLTFVLAEVCKWQSSPHNYIETINDFVYDNNYRSYFVFPRWDSDDDTESDDNKSSKEDWLKFANVVNSVFMFVTVFAYIGLYAANIPKPTHHISYRYPEMFSDIK